MLIAMGKLYQILRPWRSNGRLSCAFTFAVCTGRETQHYGRGPPNNANNCHHTSFVRNAAPRTFIADGHREFAEHSRPIRLRSRRRRRKLSREFMTIRLMTSMRPFTLVRLYDCRLDCPGIPVPRAKRVRLSGYRRRVRRSPPTGLE
jgi:hypothetical protein